MKVPPNGWFKRENPIKVDDWVRCTPILNGNTHQYAYVFVNMCACQCTYGPRSIFGYIWYIAPSHQFLQSALSFFRFWHVSKCYRFLKRVHYRLPNPSSISKIKNVSNTTLHSPKFWLQLQLICRSNQNHLSVCFLFRCFRLIFFFVGCRLLLCMVCVFFCSLLITVFFLVFLFFWFC